VRNALIAALAKSAGELTTDDSEEDELKMTRGSLLFAVLRALIAPLALVAVLHPMWSPVDK
jgi:hypothetical protein